MWVLSGNGHTEQGIHLSPRSQTMATIVAFSTSSESRSAALIAPPDETPANMPVPRATRVDALQPYQRDSNQETRFLLSTKKRWQRNHETQHTNSAKASTSTGMKPSTNKLNTHTITTATTVRNQSLEHTTGAVGQHLRRVQGSAWFPPPPAVRFPSLGPPSSCQRCWAGTPWATCGCLWPGTQFGRLISTNVEDQQVQTTTWYHGADSFPSACQIFQLLMQPCNRCKGPEFLSANRFDVN